MMRATARPRGWPAASGLPAQVCPHAQQYQQVSLALKLPSAGASTMVLLRVQAGPHARRSAAWVVRAAPVSVPAAPHARGGAAKQPSAPPASGPSVPSSSTSQGGSAEASAASLDTPSEQDQEELMLLVKLLPPSVREKLEAHPDLHKVRCCLAGGWLSNHHTPMRGKADPRPRGP